MAQKNVSNPQSLTFNDASDFLYSAVTLRGAA
ncbi:hypothetical protein PCC21_018620 [Pectobacterium carotovorum subsp. carotovorum PCC21]|nr:hypothetical protein PCC21_018620 [Pectobacterium carotovorum subsp. carotovorum PCC21]